MRDVNEAEKSLKNLRITPGHCGVFDNTDPSISAGGSDLSLFAKACRSFRDIVVYSGSYLRRMQS
jgi:hypothetical protein